MLSPNPSDPNLPGLAARLRTLLIGLAVLGLIALGAWLSYRVSERTGLSNLAAVTNERLELYAANLEAELARYSFLPSLIAAEPDVQALLARPDDPQLRERANRTLARVGVRSGARLVVVASADNQPLATSDPTYPVAGVATVLQDGSADFFAANESDGATDYWFALAVRRHGEVVGQVVVKVNLAPLEATWIDLGLRSQSERLLVVDENEVVVMASVPGWKYRSLGTAKPRRASGRYAASSLAALDLVVVQPVEPGVNLVRPPSTEGQRSAGLLLAQERPIVSLAARLVALSDPTDVRRQARAAAWGGGAGGALLGLLALYLLQRRRALRQLFQARNALQQAHDQLELQVDQRTHQLRSANEALTTQIAQREQAEDELLQAGKLAVLGQMSAGISHEINQPLTALRALSRNSMRLLEGGRTVDVATNLRTIDEMAERMGRIVNQLKSFARKDGLAMHPVTLAQAVRNVLLMLEHRLRAEPVEVVVDVPEDCRVRADANRLEQVLLNLAGNALDAMTARPQDADANHPPRLLRFAALPTPDARVLLQVEDTGPGLSDTQMGRLFEPFFTSKPAGQGLGLGLVISSKIVREFGGVLRGRRGSTGMVFEFELDDAAVEEHSHV